MAAARGESSSSDFKLMHYPRGAERSYQQNLRHFAGFSLACLARIALARASIFVASVKRREGHSPAT